MTVSRSRSTAALDEREFHTWLERRLRGKQRGLLPLGDDAAALRVPRGRVAVLSTDSLVEGTHFLRDSPAARVGAAAANVSLSDVAAKGAQPAALLIALILPPGTPRTWAQEIVRGADRAGRAGGAPLVGGDTKPGPVRAVISTVLGWGWTDRLGPRTRARRGDLLVTTGSVGRGGLAARRLSRTRRGGGASRRRALVDLLTVQPRVAEGLALGEFVHAMMDTSDGLAESTRLLAQSSGCRLVVEEDRLPLARGLRDVARTPKDRRTIAFYGGDYELLAAIPPTRLEGARGAVRRVGGRLTPIGRVEPGTGAWLEGAQGVRPMPPAGWRPFARRGPRLA